MHASLRIAGGFVASVSFVFVACGGKTVDGLDAGDAAPATTGSSQPDTGVPFDAGGRTCLPNCTVGHQCCINGCGGIPAAMPSSCCSCLPNETDSLSCNSGKCGG